MHIFQLNPRAEGFPKYRLVLELKGSHLASTRLDLDAEQSLLRRRLAGSPQTRGCCQHATCLQPLECSGLVFFRHGVQLSASAPEATIELSTRIRRHDPIRHVHKAEFSLW